MTYYGRHKVDKNFDVVVEVDILFRPSLQYQTYILTRIVIWKTIEINNGPSCNPRHSIDDYSSRFNWFRSERGNFKTNHLFTRSFSQVSIRGISVFLLCWLCNWGYDPSTWCKDWNIFRLKTAGFSCLTSFCWKLFSRNKKLTTLSYGKQNLLHCRTNFTAAGASLLLRTRSIFIQVIQTNERSSYQGNKFL